MGIDGMRPSLGLFATAALAACAVAGAHAQQAGRSVWDGVYTEAQATRGEAAYADRCGECHGANLAGTGEAKPLTGGEFLSSWNGLSLGDLYDRIKSTMPIQAPGSLSREQYADILAYVLKYDGYPVGAAELPPRSEMLAAIRMDAAKPTPAAPGADAAATAEAGPNDAPNPYTSDAAFFHLPLGRAMGSSSSVAGDSHGHIWVVDRCGANSCVGSPLDPVMEFDANGKFLKAFGAGLFVFPHGLFIDAHDHVWIADNRAEGGKGAQVHEFDPSGKLIRSLGKAGVSATGTDTFLEPNAVVVGKDGTIWVADGHTAGKGDHRIVKFSPDGKFVRRLGFRGDTPGAVEVPHALALDSKGDLYIADRWNNRVEVFDPDGRFLATWGQFGRPSGVFVDKDDMLYVADSESRAPDGYGHHPGWKRGIRIGSTKDGRVTAFIPDDAPDPDQQPTSGPEGLWADGAGHVYGAQVLQKRVMRYTRAH
jgi:mono/diheme cytochrome c family protein/sugar lactone lactonase YvrE